jgi:hypothetical protein
MVEPQPSKLMARVRFPLPAPDAISGIGGVCIVPGRLTAGQSAAIGAAGIYGCHDAHIAQQVEHFLGKEEATGSNPVVSTIFRSVRA